MLSERRRRFTFEHFPQIFLVLCNISINEEALCDYSDKNFFEILTLLCFSILT